MTKPASGLKLSHTSDNSYIVYTPVYSRSPGTRYRVDLLLESLRDFGLNSELIVDERENVLKQFYERFSANLLSKKLIWDMIGRRIARNVSSKKPHTVLLMLDVTAGSVKYLQKQGIRTVVFVEDLTATYNDAIRADRERAKQVMKRLCGELAYSDLVVTPSYVLSRVLAEEYGIEASTAPIGTKTYVSLDTAYKRERNLALHAGQIHDNRQAMALTRISKELAEHRIKALAYRAGRYARFVNDVTWYNYASPEQAIPYVQRAFLGIVTRFRPAFTLSSLYYHMGLLQPILAVGYGPWMDEAELLGVSMVKDINMIDSVDVQKQACAASRMLVPHVHKPLIDTLRRL